MRRSVAGCKHHTVKISRPARAQTSSNNWRERRPDGLLPAPPNDDSGHIWHHPDSVLIRVTKFGVQKLAGPDHQSPMAAFEKRLSDDDIAAALSYIENSWSPELRRRHEAVNRSGEGQQRHS